MSGHEGAAVTTGGGRCERQEADGGHGEDGRRFLGERVMKACADYIASLRAVRTLLEQAGSAALVRWEDLWANKAHVLTMYTRIALVRAGGTSLAARAVEDLSEHVKELFDRLEETHKRERLAAEVILDAAPVIETRAGYVIESAPPAAA